MVSEFTPRGRIVRIIIDLLDKQIGYTKKELMAKYDKGEDSILEDIATLRFAGFIIETDKKYRYAFKENRPYKQLTNLLHFSEDDKLLLERAIDQVSPHTKSGDRLKRKLGALYDYHKLGHAYLRKPYLTKLDLLEKAQTEKKVVTLEKYRSSNSNKISNRNVEPFYINPSDDSLHAFDIDKKELRHFRISRFKRVLSTETDWQYEGFHHIKLTDPFRINDDVQIPVHIRFDVGAYNELIERFPKTELHIIEDAEEGVYDFQCSVNHRFLGLTNFILGFHHQLVEIVEPESLREHIAAQLEKIKEKLDY